MIKPELYAIIIAVNLNVKCLKYWDFYCRVEVSCVRMYLDIELQTDKVSDRIIVNLSDDSDSDSDGKNDHNKRLDSGIAPLWNILVRYLIVGLMSYNNNNYLFIL